MANVIYSDCILREVFWLSFYQQDEFLNSDAKLSVTGLS